MSTPYIGITGFMSRKDAEEAWNRFSHPDRLLMIGVLANNKTVEQLTQDQPQRYPHIADIATIFPTKGTIRPNILNLIHFNTSDTSTLAYHLEVLTSIAGRSFGGFQLNVPWVDPNILQTYRKRHPGKKIVLQIRRSFSPRKAAELIAERYARLFDYLLIDQSLGTGRKLKVGRTRKYLQCFREVGVEEYAGLVISGGVCAQTAPSLVGPLVDEFPNLSVDMEGRIRDKYDRLDVEKASAAVDELSAVFSPAQHLRSATG